ncbi:MAG: DEAD/DEAH box helicase, partial [Fusobacteriaceae bacterium]|nr:DEAD/DEAH box helicase [Fusobacteriaceae bacterium]
YKALSEIRKLSQEINNRNPSQEIKVSFCGDIKKIPSTYIPKKVEIDFLQINSNKMKILPNIIGDSGEIDEKTNAEFLKEFSKNGNIKKYYNIEVEGHKKNIVIPKELREVLQTLKEEREEISVSDLLNKKSKIFNDSRMECENIEIIYGPRVKGIGFATYRPSSMTTPSNINWLEKEFPFIYTTDDKIQLFPENIEYFSEQLLKDKEQIVLDLNTDDGKRKIQLEKYQLENELQKIKDSIKSYCDFKQVSSVKKILELAKNSNSNYIQFNGYYVYFDSIKEIENHLDTLAEKEKINKNKNLMSEKATQKFLILAGNEEFLEHSETFKNKITEFEFQHPIFLLENIQPYEFQKKSIAQLQSLYLDSPINGLLLSDDMGLGKTLQILTFLAWLKEKGEVTPSLIVLPAALIYNWHNESEDQNKIGEIQKFFKSNTFISRIVKGKINRSDIKALENCDLVIMTYETLRINHVELGKISWQVMICDEAQKIKNPNALVTTAVKTQNAKFKIACSATPIENELIDLWCITDFVKPSLLGSLKEFREKYINSSSQEEEKSENELKSLNQNLKSTLGNFYIRRTKDEIFGKEPNFPKKIIRYEPVAMSSLQSELMLEFQDKKNAGDSILGIIQSMIMLCSHPRLIYKNDIDTSDINLLLHEANKLKIVKDILDKIKLKNEKAIIFTKYRGMHNILSNFVHDFYGFTPVVISGDVENKRRKELLDEYRIVDGFNIIILSPEAAGVGLNITEANHVIHYTRLWNSAKEDQATDRAYRIGQNKDVYVYYPIIFENAYNKEPQQFTNYKEMNSYFEEKHKFTSPEENLNKILLRKKMMLEDFFLASPPESSERELEAFFK